LGDRQDELFDDDPCGHPSSDEPERGPAEFTTMLRTDRSVASNDVAGVDDLRPPARGTLALASLRQRGIRALHETRFWHCRKGGLGHVASLVRWARPATSTEVSAPR